VSPRAFIVQPLECITSPLAQGASRGFELGDDLRGPLDARALLRDEDDVEAGRKELAMQAKSLADAPLDPVPADGVPDPLGDGDPEPGPLVFARTQDDEKGPGVDAMPTPLNLTILGPLPQPVVS
jgi:hypothetical protein